MTRPSDFESEGGASGGQEARCRRKRKGEAPTLFDHVLSNEIDC